MFRIRLSGSIQPCWVADCEGDPGRTCKAEDALSWRSQGAAGAYLQSLKEDYPNRQFELDQF